jgi:hypothetical protein
VSTELRDSKVRETTHTLSVRAVFRLVDERHAQQVAAGMIDRAHEIANLPECECDVDVSVELVRSENGGGAIGNDGDGGTGRARRGSGAGDPGGARAPGSAVKH